MADPNAAQSHYRIDTQTPMTLTFSLGFPFASSPLKIIEIGQLGLVNFGELLEYLKDSALS